MKVVVVDDVKTNLLVFKTMLKDFENVKTFLFDNPKEVISWVKENIPDLVITDYMMPEIDGITLTVEIRKILKEQQIPIIMVTAYGDDKVKIEALEKGVTDFLTKPVNKAEFNARIKNLLKLRDYQIKISNKAKWLEDEVKKATFEIEKREEEIIFRLSKAAEYRDDDTGDHIKRMATYSKIIAENLGLDKNFVEMIFKASPMHDVGKIGIPDNILLKPGRLTKEEFEVIKTHPELGYRILADSDIPLLKLSAEISLTHHEKFDGSGYPRGLKGEGIPISGRICAVADVFDALTSKRPYKEPWPVEKAVDLIVSEKGKHFDPDCVDAFLKDFDRVLEVKKKYFR